MGGGEVCVCMLTNNSYTYLYFADLWFMVNWLERDEDGEELVDILPAKKVIAENVDSLEIGSVQDCSFGVDGKLYKGELLAKGMTVIILA